MNSPAPVSLATPVETQPQNRTTLRFLYAACVILSLLSIGFVAAIILVVRQVYMNTR